MKEEVVMEMQECWNDYLLKLPTSQTVLEPAVSWLSELTQNHQIFRWSLLFKFGSSQASHIMFHISDFRWFYVEYTQRWPHSSRIFINEVVEERGWRQMRFKTQLFLWTSLTRWMSLKSQKKSQYPVWCDGPVRKESQVTGRLGLIMTLLKLAGDCMKLSATPNLPL